MVTKETSFEPILESPCQNLVAFVSTWDLEW